MDVAELITAGRGGNPARAGRLLSLVESDRRDEVLGGGGSGDRSGDRRDGSARRREVDDDRRAGVGVSRTRTTGCGPCRRPVIPPTAAGALLGDRIRMAAHINDADVLIRSVATRGHLGGLAAAVPAAIRLLAALGYDVVLLETVGWATSEIEIAAVADPNIVILNPGPVMRCRRPRPDCSRSQIWWW